jgi:hypothetical protein
MEDEFIEHAPAHVIADVHRMGHEIIVLVAKIMESPINNAHYTEDILEAAEDMAKFFEDHGLTGDGNEPAPIAVSAIEPRRLSDLVVDMAQLGLTGLFDRMKEE